MLCFGDNAMGARIFFSFLGIGTFFMLFLGALKKSQDINFFLIFAIFLIGNIALVLFFRQARYYSPGIFLITLLTLLNVNCLGTGKKMWLAALALVLLYLVNQLWALAAALCLAIDIFLWQPKTSRANWRAFFGPIIAGCFSIGVVSFVWNPFLTSYGEHLANNSALQRAELLCWNFRDFNSAELGSLPFLILSLFVGFWKKDSAILRALSCLMVFFLVIAACSPQPVSNTSVADVRYLSPMIPFAAGITAKTISHFLEKRNIVRLGISSAFAFTTLYQGAPILMQLRSTPVLFVREMLSETKEPYSVATRWLQKNILGQKTIFVVPGYMAYPLMFHAPEFIYAWQLRPEQKQEEQFKDLPDIHFKGLVPPDYIVVFGPSVEQVRQLMSQWSMQGLRYQEVTRLMTFWKDLYRPELFWRTFKPIEKFDPNTEAIYIFQRQS
jgi:hypothetical protein